MSNQEPWWNDKDKAGGLAATIVLIGLAVLVVCLCVSLGIVMLSWAIG